MRPIEKFTIRERVGTLVVALFALLLISLSIALYYLVFQQNIEVLGAVAVFLSALTAGIVALSINETVSQRRNAQHESKLLEHRETVYREIVTHLVSSFIRGGPRKSEGEIRTLIGLWASDNFIDAYEEWRDSIKGLAGKGDTAVTIPQNRKIPMQEALAKVVLAAREDFSIDSSIQPSVQQLTSVFFDDYSSRSH